MKDAGIQRTISTIVWQRKCVCMHVCWKNAYLCVSNTTHQPKTQPWPDQTGALSHRGVWPFVTDVSDKLKNTTTKNSVISPVNTGETVWPLQKAWQQNKETQCWTNTGAQVVIRAGDLSGRGRTHCTPLSPSVQREIWQQVSAAGAQTRCPPLLCLPATEGRQKEYMIGFSETSEDSSVWCSGEY